jgi:hypothetical protein
VMSLWQVAVTKNNRDISKAEKRQQQERTEETLLVQECAFIVIVEDSFTPRDPLTSGLI